MIYRVVPTTCVLAAMLAASASADVFVLRNGGQIEGLHVNSEDKWAREYVVRTADGGQMTIARSDVKEVVRRRDEEVAYDRVAPSYADTVDDQLKLADWCREHFLSIQEKAHLRRVVEIDPDHVRARARLKQKKVDGEWISDEELKQRQGLVYYRGKWRTKQEIELIEQRSLTDQKQKAWMQTLKRLRDDLDSRDTSKANLARDRVLEINDPHAVKALHYYFALETDKPSRDPNKSRAIKQWYIAALSSIGTAESLAALVEYSLKDPDVELRIACYETVGKAKASSSTNRYMLALKDKENEVVQRAAVGLRYIGDRRAIGPLIDALITQHTFELAPTGATGPGSINSTFDKSGNGIGGLSGGGGGLGVNMKPQKVRKTFLNEEVHRTLTKLSGQDFEFNQKLWKKWLGTQKEVPQFDGRRD
ncbi:MAG: hypothetical protein DCC68_26820 [Planctomycetota bacterium]|nr:MAG: hypothetical protein DCC68_26820 [Planctomycetota bacterium]